MYVRVFFFFNDTATTEIYTLSLHDALPIYPFDRRGLQRHERHQHGRDRDTCRAGPPKENRSRTNHSPTRYEATGIATRSEEHTSELQSRQYLVCRLLLEKKKHTYK